MSPPFTNENARVFLCTYRTPFATNVVLIARRPQP